MYGPNHPERIKLNNQIRDWNSNRLDLFEISEPNEYLEFYGVMRFFYQGEDLKYQTKCLRVSSTATTLDLIEAVVIKFHPDLKMLSNDRYALYESHNLQDRRMKENEHPLIVQLNWAYDDKDGKFILKNESRRRRSTDLTNHAMLNNYGMSKSTSALGNAYESQTLRSQSSAVYSTSSSNFFAKRMLSAKKSKRKNRGESESEQAQRIAAELSGKPPESSFTRTISNPDEVMKRRRQRKLESRLEQFSGDNETGGTLKIYGDSINPDIPYKTLLLSVNDTAEKVLAETLDKYGLAQEDHRFYLLVQQNIPPKSDRHRGEMPEEIILHDQDCPLGILVHCPPKRGNATFAVRRRTPMDKLPSKARMPPFSISKDTLPKSPGPQTKIREPNFNKPVPQSPIPVQQQYQIENAQDYPRLVKLIIDDEGNLFDENEIYSLISLISRDSTDLSPIEGSKFIKIGSQQSSVGNFPNVLLSQIDYPDIRSTHCHISAKLDPQQNSIKLTLTPTLDSTSRTPKPCLVYINQEKITKSTKLEDDDIIQIGESVLFRFEDVPNEPINLIKPTGNLALNNSHHYNSLETIQMNYLTADLPVTVKYNYNLSEDVIDKIMILSKAYADKGSKDLFSSNSDPSYHNLDELFRLAPAYMFYLVLRSGLGKEQQVPDMINNIAQNIEQVIQEDKNSVEKEVFWLSNTSELLHLLQCDNDLRNYSGPAQDILASAIEQAFTILQNQFSNDLLCLLPGFIDEEDFDENDDSSEDIIPCLDRASVLITYGDIDYPIQHLLQTLSLAYTLFHNCQVNVALTIQMFSQLFHLLNTWLFNAVLGDTNNNVSSEMSQPLPICPEWGVRLTRRLTRIRNWSETNGLDMAANCHLQKMYQVAELMEADKKDLNAFGEKCLELININGTQLHYLLENCEDYELPNAWIEVVVNTAIQWHDQAFNGGVPQNRSNLPLLEDLDLRLPLLLPADGYCCDRGIVSCPKDLKNMLNSLKGILTYKLNPPTISQVDTRWKAYLGPYENTPSVSRSGTIADQSPVAPLKIDIQQRLQKHWASDERSSMNLSSVDSQVDSVSSPRAIQSTKKQLFSSPMPSKPIQPDFSDMSDDSHSTEVIKSDLSSRYKLKLKKINNSLGLSIIAARKSQNESFRIYIKDVIPNGAGHKCGKIQIGDQLVSVDGILLENINQDEAVEFMKKTKSEVHLLMERGAAEKYGIMEIIMKSKILKGAQKPPNLPAKISTIQKSKTPVNQSKTPKEPNRPVSRETLNQKKQPVLENEPKKRTDYRLPPVPVPGKAPPRPVRLTTNNTNKLKIENENLSEPDYHSLPVRKNPSKNVSTPKDSIYSTVTKNKSPRVTDDTAFNSLQNLRSKPQQSSSQPNLFSTLPKKRIETPVSSSSGSVSTSDDEEIIEKKPVVPPVNNQNRKKPSLYAKLPPPKPKVNVTLSPVKAASENNIQLSTKGMPRDEVVTSDPINSRSAKNKLFTRPEIASNSEPIMKPKFEDNYDKNLKNPIQLSNKKYRSQSSSSESESVTLSSPTPSISSDPSPKPSRKLSSEPIISIKQNEPIKNPLKSEGHSIIIPMEKIDKVKPNQPKSDISNDIPKVTQEIPMPPCSPPPLPTANHPQYHPPKDLEERDWNSESKKPLVKPIVKPPTEEEIRIRRKAMEDKIRKETEMRDKMKQYSPSSPDSKSDNPVPFEADLKPSPNRSSVQYGRPKFENNKVNRPESLFQPRIDNNDTSLPSPSLLRKGVIVPASPPSNSQIIGANEVYKDPYKAKQDNQPTKIHESGEQLSFKEKMKLFNQINGETQVVNRNKFSSKQRKIESGDFS